MTGGRYRITHGGHRQLNAAIYRTVIVRIRFHQPTIDYERELRLLVDHREDLVAERTRVIARLRWHLHELDPGWLPPGKLERASAYDRVAAHLARFDELVARLAMTLIQHCRRLTIEIDELAGEIGERVQQIAPPLLAVVGCAALTAAKIIGETAGVDRFRSKDAFARHNGSAPLPGSGRPTERATVCPAPETANSTPRSTASLARRHVATRTHEHCWPNARPKATAAWRRCGSSNADSPTSSTAP
nr:hypothetical protein [Nocardia araoensis]